MTIYSNNFLKSIKNFAEYKIKAPNYQLGKFPQNLNPLPANMKMYANLKMESESSIWMGNLSSRSGLSGLVGGFCLMNGPLARTGFGLKIDPKLSSLPLQQLQSFNECKFAQALSPDGDFES